MTGFVGQNYVSCEQILVSWPIPSKTLGSLFAHFWIHSREGFTVAPEFEVDFQEVGGLQAGVY